MITGRFSTSLTFPLEVLFRRPPVMSGVEKVVVREDRRVRVPQDDQSTTRKVHGHVGMAAVVGFLNKR